MGGGILSVLRILGGYLCGSHALGLPAQRMPKAISKYEAVCSSLVASASSTRDSAFCIFYLVVLGADFHCLNVFVGGAVDDGLADTRLGLLIELLHDAALHIQLFLYPLAVKAVFQVACGDIGSIGTPIGVDAFRSLLYALTAAALLFSCVGKRNALKCAWCGLPSKSS